MQKKRICYFSVLLLGTRTATKRFDSFIFFNLLDVKISGDDDDDYCVDN